MPLYVYECDACGHRFEKIQKFSDSPLETCPQCGGTLHKVITSPAFQFKGTGWYVTDYAKKDSSGGGKDGPKESGGSEKDGASTSESAKNESSKAESSTSSAEAAPSSAPKASDKEKPTGKEKTRPKEKPTAKD